MSDRLKISTKRPKKRRGFCKSVNIDDDSSNNVEENSSNSVQNKLLLPAESEVDVYVIQEATISSGKVEEIPVNDINDSKSVCGYRFMDLDILSAVFKGLKCHTNECESDLVLSENSKNKKGLANELVIGCDCRYNSSFYTFSKQSFDVNETSVYKIVGNVTVVVKSIAQQIMQDACDDIKNKNTDMENGVTDTATLYAIDVYKIIH